ncbi:MAG: cysteine hydrolase family protein [Methermicoccaceae archaeon]
MLLIVDMQNDFCSKGGTLYSKKSENIIHNIEELQESFRDVGAHVAYTQDWHEADDSEFDVWGAHCVEGTWGAEIVDELAPLELELVFKKTRYTPFYDTDIHKHLLELEIRDTVVCGTLANVCVLHTACDIVMRGVNAIIPVECIAALSDYDMGYAMYHVEEVFKARICSANDIKFE